MRRLLRLLLLMAVTFDANATADSTANGVTSINHANLTIGSGTNRALVAQICWSGTVGSPVLKWDNTGTPQTMTAITNASAFNGTVAGSQLFGLVAPTSGNKTLNAAWTTARDVCLNGVSWTGVDQTGGNTTFPNGAGATGSSTTASVTVTSATGNAVMAAHTVTSTMSAVNNTQTFRDQAPTNISAGGNRAAGGASVSMTATVGSSTWASAGTDIAAAASVTFIAAEPLIVRQAVNRAGTY